MGRWPQALSDLDQWLARSFVHHTKADPAIRHAWATRAHVLGVLGRWAEACDQLEALANAWPNDPVHRFNWGYALQQRHAWHPAEQAFRAALRLDPHLDLAWYGLGDVLCQQGKLAEAEHAWEQQTALQPFCPDGLARLVALHAGLEQWSKAEACLERLKAFDPRRAMGLAHLWTPELGAAGGAQS